ncbi:MAG TPA: 4Fe-4S binding protein [Myxococcales bacterium]|jgi:Fe-S-cluster-containing hydrogenase component 2
MIQPVRLPIVDLARCSGCGECAARCPTGAVRAPQGGACARCVKYCLSFEVPCRREARPFRYELCDSCGKCVKACASGAIVWTSAGAAREALAPAKECRAPGMADAG